MKIPADWKRLLRDSTEDKRDYEKGLKLLEAAAKLADKLERQYGIGVQLW